MLNLISEGVYVAETYSPPRVATHAAAWGMRPGWSLDVTDHDMDGEPWGFSEAEMRTWLWAVRCVRVGRP